MDDVMNKISGILSDEESLRQLSELMQMINSGEVPDCGENAEEQAAESDCGGESGMPDMEMIMKLMTIVGTLNQQDKNTELLIALRPHLGSEKQKRLDKAMKLLKIAAVYSAAKESGALNNLF